MITPETERNGARYLRLAVPIVLFVSLLLRVQVATVGHNYDLESWAIVAQVVSEGENVYANTTRYNYGPPWFLIVDAILVVAKMFPDPGYAFALLIPLLLGMVDIGIALLLRRRWGDLPAILFALHPLSILISGFHRQFGNLAILVALLAAWSFTRSKEGPGGARWWVGLFLLGFSLMVKHLYFALNWWLALRQHRWWLRMTALAVPPIVFLAGFIPYWGVGRDGIIHNVFLYQSFSNAPLVSWLPEIVGALIPPILVLLAALFVGGWVFRKVEISEAVLAYLAILVVFSPAVANQYLVLPIAWTVVRRNPMGWLYGVLCTLRILADPNDGLKLTFLEPLWRIGLLDYPVLILALLAYLGWNLWLMRHQLSEPEAG